MKWIYGFNMNFFYVNYSSYGLSTSTKSTCWLIFIKYIQLLCKRTMLINYSFISADTFPQQNNYSSICKCRQKCDRVTYDVWTTQAPFSSSVITKLIFSRDLPNLYYKLENLRQWTNLDTMNHNSTLQINSISRMYLQIKNILYDLALLFTSTPAEAHSSDDRFQCVASLLPFYRTLITNITEWEKNSYYLNFTATKSNKPRTDDFLTRFVHDIISHSNEMDRFLSELNHMLGTFWSCALGNFLWLAISPSRLQVYKIPHLQ